MFRDVWECSMFQLLSTARSQYPLYPAAAPERNRPALWCVVQLSKTRMSPATNSGLRIICVAFVASPKNFRNSNVLDAPCKVFAYKTPSKPAKKTRVMLGNFNFQNWWVNIRISCYIHKEKHHINEKNLTRKNQHLTYMKTWLIIAVIYAT